MRRHWLLFSQTVTVLLAAWFIVATLKPQWLQGMASSQGITLLQASGGDDGHRPAGSLSGAAQKASPAVVSINTSQNRGKNPNAQDPWFRFFYGDQEDNAPAGLGSGVIVSPEGHILTNNHVIEEADDIEVVLTDGRRTAAKVIGTDPDTDLALLKISLDKLPVIVLGQSEQLQVGDVVLAIGNPFGVGQTVTSGIVSALGRNLMGINTAIYSRSGGNMGIGFAIPVSTAQQVMRELISKGRVTRGWIGVEPQDLSPELAASFNLPSRNGQALQGVVITGVLQNGPAAKAGIRPGDVIVQVDQQKTGNVSELLSQVAALEPGKPARVQVWRAQGLSELTITPGMRPAPAQRR